MHIKNHTINVSHGTFGGLIESEEVTAQHEMTITFTATLDGGLEGWVGDLINAIGAINSKHSIFLSRSEVHKIRNEYLEPQAQLSVLPQEEDPK